MSIADSASPSMSVSFVSTPGASTKSVTFLFVL